jgi:UTP--glucose-1-phosphate uridylyltransferase
MLDELLERGYRFLFLSNSDNLGAVLEPRILGWLAAEGLPFLSESTDRTESDRKGGHLARRTPEGGLVLRETAQTTDEDMAAFEDISRHRFFNCNNIWVDLTVLQRTLEERGGVLGLPMIVNRKTVDPTDSSSPEVLQLETAMGAAIGVFEGAAAIRVPRTRFAPVKTTNQLLIVRSDAYELRDDWTVESAADPIPLVSLDPDYYKLIADFDARFSAGPPSLRDCRRLDVEGDVSFGRDVAVEGEVRLRGPRTIPDGTVLAE